MKRNVLIAIILSLTLSACAVNEDYGGHAELGDPVFCSENNAPACELLIGALIVGCGAALVSSR